MTDILLYILLALQLIFRPQLQEIYNDINFGMTHYTDASFCEFKQLLVRN